MTKTTRKPQLSKNPCACGCGGYPSLRATAIRGHMPRRPLAERLDEKLDKSGECWEFTGWRDSLGYGRIGHGKGRGRSTTPVMLAHRAAWEVANGPIPDGMLVCHKCDNPPCCNPAHLFLGTSRDNAMDMRRKHRGYDSSGTNNNRTRLTEDQVRELRAIPYYRGLFTQKARELGVTPAAIRFAYRGINWKYLK